MKVIYEVDEHTTKMLEYEASRQNISVDELFAKIMANSLRNEIAFEAQLRLVEEGMNNEL